MTQERLAEVSGVSQSVISRAERCDRGITLDTAYLLAKAFGLTIDDFLKEVRDVSKS